MNFATIKAGGLRPSDVAKLLRISRVAVSLWFNGHSQPHRLIEMRVHRLEDAVRSALQSGDLPISRDVPRDERYEAKAAAVHKHLQQLGLAAIDS